jgi:peptidoglycan/xylan/chitin deacetylase (PgdA/CDA1 family)
LAKAMIGCEIQSRERSGLAKAVVLTFHGIHRDGQTLASQDPATARYFVAEDTFARALAELPSDRCCTVAEFARYAGGDWRIATFDDGLISDYEFAFPMLLQGGLRGTFFVTVDNIGRAGYTSVAQLREMIAGGMEIGSHGLTHRYLVTMSTSEATREIRESKARLEETLGVEVHSFAAVGGHFKRWMLEIAAEAGYRAFATMIPGRTTAQDGLLLLRRNHIQGRHGNEYISRVIRGCAATLFQNQIRYHCLAIPKKAIGLRSYDRLKGRFFD